MDGMRIPGLSQVCREGAPVSLPIPHPIPISIPRAVLENWSEPFHHCPPGSRGQSIGICRKMPLNLTSWRKLAVEPSRSGAHPGPPFTCLQPWGNHCTSLSLFVTYNAGSVTLSTSQACGEDLMPSCVSVSMAHCRPKPSHLSRLVSHLPLSETCHTGGRDTVGANALSGVLWLEQRGWAARH